MNENFPDINHHLKSSDLFDAFKRQLMKDFEQSNFSTAFITGLEPNYSLLLTILMTELEQHQKGRDASFMRLLNRIDISEAQLIRYLKESENKDQLAVIAELIIKRVLQKVVIQHYYKKAPGQSDSE
jgi:hypothetical protein